MVGIYTQLCRNTEEGKYPGKDSQKSQERVQEMRIKVSVRVCQVETGAKVFRSKTTNVSYDQDIKHDVGII